MLSILCLEFELRIGLVVPSIEQLVTKIAGRGIFIISSNPFFSFPVATPQTSTSLSPLCSSTSSSHSPPCTRQKSSNLQQIFATPSLQRPPIQAPLQVSIGAKFGQRSEQNHHVFGRLGDELEHEHMRRYGHAI